MKKEIICSGTGRHIAGWIVISATLLQAPLTHGGDRNVTRTSVNRNVNVNQNINVNRNVNVDVDVHHNYHPVAVAAAVTATAVVTAAVVGSIVHTLPTGCTTVVVNGIGYQQCGTVWYQPQFAGTQVTYVVVNPVR